MLPELREIARRRKTLGLTQTRLAREAGASQSLVAKVEAGKADPSYSKAKQLFDSLTRLENEGALTAGDVMHRGVRFVSSEDSVSKAVKKMRSSGLSQLPVTEGGRVAGSLSESRVVKCLGDGFDAAALSRTRVGEIMGEEFPQATPSTPLRTVTELLKSSPAVLVTSKGKIRGIITKADVLSVVHK
jgi:predicted transcriptional regulator